MSSELPSKGHKWDKFSWKIVVFELVVQHSPWLCTTQFLRRRIYIHCNLAHHNLRTEGDVQARNLDQTLRLQPFFFSVDPNTSSFAMRFTLEVTSISPHTVTVVGILVTSFYNTWRLSVRGRALYTTLWNVCKNGFWKPFRLAFKERPKSVMKK